MSNSCPSSLTAGDERGYNWGSYIDILRIPEIFCITFIRHASKVFIRSRCVKLLPLVTFCHCNLVSASSVNCETDEHTSKVFISIRCVKLLPLAFDSRWWTGIQLMFIYWHPQDSWIFCITFIRHASKDEHTSEVFIRSRCVKLLSLVTFWHFVNCETDEHSSKVFIQSRCVKLLPPRHFLAFGDCHSFSILYF